MFEGVRLFRLVGVVVIYCVVVLFYIYNVLKAMILKQAFPSFLKQFDIPKPVKQWYGAVGFSIFILLMIVRYTIFK
ncbi:MAG: hypothetical protein NVSMB24_03420 [Mucilaginibacter sp.]